MVPTVLQTSLIVYALLFATKQQYAACLTRVGNGRRRASCGCWSCVRACGAARTMVLAPPAIVARSGVYSCEVFVLVPPLPAIDDELMRLHPH